MLLPVMNSMQIGSPLQEVGLGVAVRNIAAQNAQVTMPSPYFRLEANTPQLKQSIAEKRSASRRAVKPGDDAEVVSEDTIIYGASTLFMAQLYAQSEEKIEPANDPVSISEAPITEEQIVSAREALYYKIYSALTGIGIFPSAQTVVA